MTVLVTGASGFVGRSAVRALVARGLPVAAVTRGDGDGLDVKGVQRHQADLLDAGERRTAIEAIRPAFLLHLAWDTTHAAFWTAPSNLSWLAASVELLRLFTEAGGARAVIAGTCAEYAWTSGDVAAGKPCREASTTISPESLYGASKAALTMTAVRYAEVARISLAVGRIFFPYGEGEGRRRLVPSIINALLDGEEASTTAGEQERDLLHVDDVGAALVALLLATEVKGAVNIGSGQGTTIETVAGMLGEITGRPDLLRVGALPTSPSQPRRLVADVSRLQDAVGFVPQVPLRRGLERAVRSWERARNRLSHEGGADSGGCEQGEPTVG